MSDTIFEQIEVEFRRDLPLAVNLARVAHMLAEQNLRPEQLRKVILVFERPVGGRGGVNHKGKEVI